MYHERGRSQVRATSVTCDPKGPAHRPLCFSRKLHSDSGYWMCRSIAYTGLRSSFPSVVLSWNQTFIAGQIFVFVPNFLPRVRVNFTSADVGAVHSGCDPHYSVMIQTMSVCTISTTSTSSLCKSLRISYIGFPKAFSIFSEAPTVSSGARAQGLTINTILHAYEHNF